MSLAAILGLCLLLPSWEAAITLSVPAIVMAQSAPPQKSQPGDSSFQRTSPQPPTDQQKAPDQTAQQPCPDSLQPPPGAKSDCKPAESNAKTKKHHRAHKAAVPATTPAAAGPTKTVIRNGSEADPTVDLSPTPSPQEASRLNTYNQLLATTDTNLEKISGRQLSASQQDTVKQIKSYMEQAKEAAKDTDLQRAYNLAVKANLLSAELVEH
jgi:hypothetical protein